MARGASSSLCLDTPDLCGRTGCTCETLQSARSVRKVDASPCLAACQVGGAHNGCRVKAMCMGRGAPGGMGVVSLLPGGERGARHGNRKALRFGLDHCSRLVSNVPES